MGKLMDTQDQQFQRELELKEQSRLSARQVIEQHSKDNGWTEQETTQVIQMLGLHLPSRHTRRANLVDFNGRPEDK